MIIRPIIASDRAEWAPLWQGYLDFYKSSLAPEITEATFARLIDPASPIFGFVAERDGQLIGLVHCVAHPATWSAQDYCYLEDLFVAPSARNSGAGRALIEAVYQRADEKNYARVYWHTHESNATAQLLYDRIANKSGFIVYRRK